MSRSSIRPRAIGYGVCVGPGTRFESSCWPALERFSDGPVYLRSRQRSIATAYNSIMAEAEANPALAALVLLHDDVELLEDPSETLRHVFQDPSIAVVGLIGSTGARSIAWWDGERVGAVASSVRQYDFGRPVGSQASEVETVDGLFLAFSPWAIANLRWDPRRYPGFHGYDAEVCSQARARNRRVVVADVGVIHHSEDTITGWVDWRRSDLRWQRRWLSMSYRDRIQNLALDLRLSLRLCLSPQWLMRSRRCKLPWPS